MKQTSSGSGLTKEQKIHNFISDVFMITNDSATNISLPAEKRRTFMYEYMSKDFTLDMIDDIMTNRLQKNRDENKFIYLMQTYRRLENHLYTKSSIASPLISSD